LRISIPRNLPAVSSQPLVLAHRGACRQARENTIEAFARARELGADGVELDVRRSADGVLVVHHDAEAPPVGLLADQPFADIRAALPWLPTLAEALDACRGWLVNVEIKCSPWERDADPDHAVVRRAVDEIRDRDVEVIVSSFDLATVDAARRYAPDLSTAFLVHGAELARSAAVAAAHGHGWLNPDRASALADPGDMVARTHGEGLRVDVWTVDDPEEIRTLAAAGVDAVITNVPDVARAVLS
jgi:glycerophosphoryl diester phosphodiesterase